MVDSEEVQALVASVDSSGAARKGRRSAIPLVLLAYQG